MHQSIQKRECRVELRLEHDVSEALRPDDNFYITVCKVSFMNNSVFSEPQPFLITRSGRVRVLPRFVHDDWLRCLFAKLHAEQAKKDLYEMYNYENFKVLNRRSGPEASV